MMKSRRVFVHVLLLTLFATCAGCFRVESLIKLAQDGSGVIYVRGLVAESLQAKFPNKQKEEMDRLAAGLGEGVRYVGSKPISEKGWKGFRFEFTFEDVTQLSLGGLLDFQDSEKKAKGEADTRAGSKLTRANKWKFEYKPGSTNELIVFRLPEEPPKQNDDPFADAGVKLPEAKSIDLGSVLASAMIRPMFSDAKVSLLLQVDGEIVSTNAVARPKPNGSTVYLMDLDLSKFAKSKEFEQVVTEDWSLDRVFKEEVPGLLGPISSQATSVKFR